MRPQVQRTVANRFAALRRLRSIRLLVSSTVFQTLIVFLVLTRLDYCNATLAGIPAALLNRLQSVLNARVRLGPLPAFVAQITLQQRSPAFTGSVYPSEFTVS